MNALGHGVDTSRHSPHVPTPMHATLSSSPFPSAPNFHRMHQRSRTFTLPSSALQAPLSHPLPPSTHTRSHPRSRRRPLDPFRYFRNTHALPSQSSTEQHSYESATLARHTRTDRVDDVDQSISAPPWKKISPLLLCASTSNPHIFSQFPPSPTVTHLYAQARVRLQK